MKVTVCELHNETAALEDGWRSLTGHVQDEGKRRQMARRRPGGGGGLGCLCLSSNLSGSAGAAGDWGGVIIEAVLEEYRLPWCGLPSQRLKREFA